MKDVLVIFAVVVLALLLLRAGESHLIPRPLEGETMELLLARASVIAHSALTWLTLLATVLTGVAGELTDATLDDGLGVDQALDTAAAWLLRVVAVIGVVVAQIRRVTPVIESQRGLLPQED